MTQIKAQTLKGFRDFLPKEAKKRQYVINALKEVFELYGFEPLETPTLEYDEILLGKYGEEGDKLMYRFEDRGGRKVAMRYDQTVPLARVVAQYGSTSSPQGLPMPFKRYQIQNVWRAENPQKGRYREFLQCDIDIVGSSSPLSDTEIIAVAAKSIEKLGFSGKAGFKILINDRNNLFNFKEGLEPNYERDLKIIRAIDKLKKIGRKKVISEIKDLGLTEQETEQILTVIETKNPTENLKNIFYNLEKLGIEKSKYEFSPVLARGLGYYTGMIFEIEIEGYEAGSIGGGGRYDNLIGMFSGKPVPAVGFAFGFDRLMEAMEELKLFPDDLISTKVLITVFSPQLKEKSMEISSLLRANNINTELYLNENATLEKQLKYADKKGIPYVVIIGPNEAEKKEITIKNLQTKEQQTIAYTNLSDAFE